MLKVARPNEHGEAARREIFRYLKTDSFIGPGDQSDRLSCIVISFLASMRGQRRRAAVIWLTRHFYG